MDKRKNPLQKIQPGKCLYTQRRCTKDKRLEKTCFCPWKNFSREGMALVAIAHIKQDWTVLIATLVLCALLFEKIEPIVWLLVFVCSINAWTLRTVRNILFKHFFKSGYIVQTAMITSTNRWNQKKEQQYKVDKNKEIQFAFSLFLSCLVNVCIHKTSLIGHRRRRRFNLKEAYPLSAGRDHVPFFGI